MKGIVTFLFLFLAGLSFGQEAYSYSEFSKVKLTEEALVEVNEKFEDRKDYQDVLSEVKKIINSDIILLSTKRYVQILTDIGEQPNIEDNNKYADWKAEMSNFKEKYLSVSELNF